MSKGWISIHRKIEDNWVWQDKPFSIGQAWIDLLLLANYEDKKELKDGRLQTYKAGTVNRSILWLSDRWGWDRKKTRRFLDLLELDNMVSVNSTTHGTTITIVNYGIYRYQGATDGTTDGQPMVQPLPINNKDNKEINNNSRRFTPPTPQEVYDYCAEKGYLNKVNPGRFVAFYESKGWFVGKNKMKDWKAAVRNWASRDQNEPSKKSIKSMDNARSYSAEDWAEMERDALRRG